ncbi:MAG: hypothetical protein LDLANPLL_01419 [Turneriella sp.]|nr:hypothetical protein [Turneriella sp.]
MATWVRVFFLRGVILIFLCVNSTYAMGAALELPGKSTEETIAKAQVVLKKLNTQCVEQEITLGANWRCKTPFFSIVSLDIYVSTLTDRAFLRADAPNRQSYAFIDAVAEENGQGPFQNKYESKSLLLTFGATLLSPALGYWYTNYNSMVRSKSTLLTTLGLFLGDAALFWMSSKTFFTHGFDPFDTGLTPMLITLGAFRAAVLVPLSIQVLAHNRFAGLQLTYRY